MCQVQSVTLACYTYSVCTAALASNSSTYTSRYICVRTCMSAITHCSLTVILNVLNSTCHYISSVGYRTYSSVLCIPQCWDYVSDTLALPLSVGTTYQIPLHCPRTKLTNMLIKYCVTHLLLIIRQNACCAFLGLLF